MLKDNINEISVISNKDANDRALSLIPAIKDIKGNIKKIPMHVLPYLLQQVDPSPHQYFGESPLLIH